jgi:outer membrane lipoprotein-sorting protein
MLRRALAILLVFSFAASAWADGRQELHAAMLRNLSLKSFKASMVDLTRNRPVSTVEFQAPDRFRVTPGGMPPSLIIGDTMYMNHGGKTMKMTMPKGSLGKYRNEDAIADLEKGAVVESLGPGMVGAEPARRYRFTSGTDKMNSTSEVWVGLRSGLVLQVETSGKNAGRPFAMRATYSDFNSPTIRITAPN